MYKAQNIFISTSSFGKHSDIPLEMLKQEGFIVKINPFRRRLTMEEQLVFYKGIDGLIAGTELLNADVLKSAENLKVISRCGAGLDNIDLDVAKHLGIKVFNTPDAPTHAVAELTLGMILNLLRKVNKMDRTMKSGIWEKELGYLLRNKKVGIIGFGRIGQEVAKLISAFGVELAYCDIETKNCSLSCNKKTFEEILSWADIITLHLSFSDRCKPLVGENELRLMKKGSWIVNLSRGGAVDENALYRVLKDGHLAGAAVDVFKEEPYSGCLTRLDNVVLTPHIGSYTRESRVRMEMEAVENLIKGLQIKGVIR